MLDVGEERTPEQINEEILKKLKPSGLVNDAPEVLKSLDKEMGEKKGSSVIPVSFTKSGISRYSSVAKKENFEHLSDFVNEKMRKIGKRILAGETQSSPYERKGHTACDYCSYREICGFDTRIPGNEFRRLREYPPEEIWKRIEEEV